MDYKVIFTLIFLMLSISCVFAEENATDTLDAVNDDALSINASALTPDVPDLVEDDTFYVNAKNIESYFPENTLDSKYENKTLVFTGEFEDIGILTIDSDCVTVKGGGSTLKNIVFDISGNNVTLKDLNMNLDKSFYEDDGAAVYVSSDNVDLINLNINYVVPYDVDAYAIFANGHPRYPSTGLRILNSTIYFEAHNDEVKKYNCAVKLLNFKDSLMENTTIIGSFPLNEIVYRIDGADLNSDFVFAVGIEGCDNFILKNNEIICDVNKRPALLYPTLDAIVLSRSDNVLMYNNSIYMTDFVTNPGIENYLYGVNVEKLTNLTIDSNRISMITTGGKMALGTAYPIQINGPIMGVNITNNDLYSFSNGPNIGVYSVNYFGESSLSITNNRINVTGLAGTDEWALVTGIESQDSNAEILNNQIEVHSVGEVGFYDNLFAISYRQPTPGSHTYNIQNNTAFTDGYMAVFLMSSYNSTVSGNTLISFNENAQTGSDSYGAGPFSHVNDNDYNNMVINIRDYLATLNNVDGGNGNNQRPSGEATSGVDGGSYSSQPTNQYTYNPLIPGYFDTHGLTDETGTADNNGLNGGTSTQTGDYDEVYDINSDVVSDNNADKKTGADEIINSTSEDSSSSINAVSNNTQATPDISGDNGPIGGMQASQSNQPSVSKKAFEITEAMKNKSEFIPSVAIVIATLILLLIGYKRRDPNFE